MRRAFLLFAFVLIVCVCLRFARPPRAFYDCFVQNCQTVLCGWDGEFLTVKGGDLK